MQRNTLPFTALVRRDETKDATHYLVEWKPIHVVVSGTVYAELKRAPGSHGFHVDLVAFADPKNPESRDDLRGLPPLPYSRQEVAALAGLFPGKAEEFVGEQATEERAKSLGRDVRYIHFATHALLNERFPLDSALVLTIPTSSAPGQDNGLLQAWEIFERVRLDTDLVTLAACDTALGSEMGGEGLVGLTRAFQYAGARSVVASLWNVADKSTAGLMRRFYEGLKDGQRKDEALRMAQFDQIRAGAHPFNWAAFQLIGDWK